MARFKGKWLGKCSLHGASGIWFFDVSDPSFFFQIWAVGSQKTRYIGGIALGVQIAPGQPI